MTQVDDAQNDHRYRLVSSLFVRVLGLIYLVAFAFKSGPSPLPIPQSGDVNCDGAVSTADIIHLVNFIFKGGPAPCNVCELL